MAAWTCPEQFIVPDFLVLEVLHVINKFYRKKNRININHKHPILFLSNFVLEIIPKHVKF